jgi:putative effector of murein hydrolase
MKIPQIEHGVLLNGKEITTPLGVSRALGGLENVTTLRELTETVVGKAIIEKFAKIGKVTPLLIKAAILARGDGKGELCQEFVRVVRKVVQS